MSDTAQAEKARIEAIEAEMASQGVPTEEAVYEDYFGFEDTNRVVLPKRNPNAADTWVEFKVMNEGDRRRYLNSQNRKVTIKKASGDAEMELAQGDDKYNLLKITIINWNLRRNGQPVPLNNRTLDEFLSSADPRVVDEIHREVTRAHPWLLAEMTLEDIDKAIEDLQETRKIVERREAGE